MAVVDSTSTEAEIAAAYLDNCGYVEDDSLAMARRFVTACMAMKKRGLKRFQQGPTEMEFSMESLREDIREARQFITGKTAVGSGGAGYTAVGFTNFRD